MDSPFQSISEAAQQRAVSPRTIRRCVARHGIEVFVDPIDTRRRLIRSADIERAIQPRPLRPQSGPAATHAG